MPRRRSPEKRKVLPDPKFKDVIVAKFMNHIMKDGKKSVAEGIVYGAFDSIDQKMKSDPVEIFKKALEAVGPVVEVKSRSCLLYTSPSPRDLSTSRMPSSA